MRLEIGPLRGEISLQKLQNVFLLIEKAVNYLDKGNFQNKIAGDDILSSASVSLNKLKWLEWPIPLVLPADPYSTTATADDDIGGYFMWDPGKYPGGIWYLEASLACNGATATCTLKGASVIGTVQSTSATMELKRSQALTMPTTAQTIWVTLKTSNASYAAVLGGARLIYVP